MAFDFDYFNDTDQLHYSITIYPAKNEFRIAAYCMGSDFGISLQGRILASTLFGLFQRLRGRVKEEPYDDAWFSLVRFGQIVACDQELETLQPFLTQGRKGYQMFISSTKPDSYLDIKHARKGNLDVLLEAY